MRSEAEIKEPCPYLTEEWCCGYDGEDYGMTHICTHPRCDSDGEGCPHMDDRSVVCILKREQSINTPDLKSKENGSEGGS